MVRVHVQRCNDMTPGQVTWLEGLNELLFVVSSHSVSPDGAATLEFCWQSWGDSGVWQWGVERPGAQPILDVTYKVGDTAGDAVVLDFHAGRVTGTLCADDFDTATAASLERAALEVAAAGWSWVPRVRAVA